LLKIETCTADLWSDVNRANEPFLMIGRVCPTYENRQWQYMEDLWSSSVPKQYPNDDWERETYLDSEDHVIFLAYREKKIVGQIVLRKDWNRYAFIEDICVAASARGQGVGSALIERAKQWAEEQYLCGLALETQDTNVLACRFYRKCGFSIGGVNTMLYRGFEKPWSEEIAIYWYLTWK